MELDSFRSKHEEIISKEDSEKNALPKERIQFSSKLKDEVAAVKKSVSISSIKCSESISSSSRRQQSQNFSCLATICSADVNLKRPNPPNHPGHPPSRAAGPGAVKTPRGPRSKNLWWEKGRIPF